MTTVGTESHLQPGAIPGRLPGIGDPRMAHEGQIWVSAFGEVGVSCQEIGGALLLSLIFFFCCYKEERSSMSASKL